MGSVSASAGTSDNKNYTAGSRAGVNITISNTDEPQNNRSLISWSSSVYDNAGNLGGYASGSSAGTHTVDVAGARRHTRSGSYDFGSGVVASPVFPRGDSGSFYIGHDGDTGAASSISGSASFSGDGDPVGSATATTASLSLSTFTGPSTPAAPSLTRSDPSLISITSSVPSSSGSVSIQVYQYQWSTDNANWSAVTNMPSSGTYPSKVPSRTASLSVNANTTYYIRTRAVTNENVNWGYGGWSSSSVFVGVPSTPTNVVGTRSTTIAGRIDVSWSKPGNTQGGIQHYHIYRNGGYLTQVNGENSLSFADTGLARGSSNSYQVYAWNGAFWSDVSAASSATIAPGVPSAPGTPTMTSKVGRTLTINSSRGSSDYGNAISEYRIQLSTDGGNTWRGWDNTAKTFTATNSYNTLDVSGNFTYQLLSPALTYRWRVYAVNSIGTGDVSATSSAIFVSSGGKRWDGSQWRPTETAKRWTGSQWTDITIAKRWNGSAWVDLT